MEAGQRGVHPLLGLLTLLLQPADQEGEPLAAVRGLGELLARLVDGRLDLDQALAGRRTTAREVRAERVTLPGHRHHVGQHVHQRAGGGQVVDDGHLVQQPTQRRPDRLGGLDHVHGVVRLAGELGPLARHRLCAAEQQAGPAEVLLLEVLDRPHRGARMVNRDRVGGRAECPGHGRLEPAAHGEQRRHRPEQPGHAVGGGEQGTRPVLAVQPQLERLLAGAERAALALGQLQLLAVLAQAVLQVGELGHRGLVLGVQALFAGVQPGDLRLQRGEVTLGSLGPRDRVLTG